MNDTLASIWEVYDSVNLTEGVELFDAIEDTWNDILMEYPQVPSLKKNREKAVQYKEAYAVAIADANQALNNFSEDNEKATPVATRRRGAVAKFGGGYAAQHPFDAPDYHIGPNELYEYADKIEASMLPFRENVDEMFYRTTVAMEDLMWVNGEAGKLAFTTYNEAMMDAINLLDKGLYELNAMRSFGMGLEEDWR